MAELHIVSQTDAPSISANDPERRYLSLADAGYATGLSKSFVHQMVQSGRLPAFRVGRRVLIATDDLENFVRQVPA